MFKLGKMTKEWWMKMAELEGDLEVGAGSMVHGSNGCCWEGCKVCQGASCYSSFCEKCYPDRQNQFAGYRQTGFDKWLEEHMKNPEFKEEYEKALKEIQEYDRRENEARRKAGLEKESPSKPS